MRTITIRNMIGIGFLRKSLLAMTVVISIALSIANPAVAVTVSAAGEQPPYGITLGDMWVVEGLDEPASYSFSPIPSYRSDTTHGPNLIITTGTKFEFFYDLDVSISKLAFWDIMGRYTGDGPDLYDAFGDGSYTFNEPGYYVVFFLAGGQLPVEVVASTAAPAPTPVPAPAPVFPVNNAVKVQLDGRTLSFDVPPQIINGRTMVPLRVIFEELGASVVWDAGTETVTAIQGTTTVSLRIGSTILSRNGKTTVLDVPAQLIDGRTLVPARAVAEAFGADVNWIESTQTVVITSGTGDSGTTDNTPSRLSGTQPGDPDYADVVYAKILAAYRDFKYAAPNLDRDEVVDALVDRVLTQVGILGEQRLYELNNSSFEAADCNELGYALKDIDGDDIPELFIISDAAYDYDDFIFAIYTIDYGSPALVRGCWSRSTCALDADGSVYCQGSNGAADSFSGLYRLDPQDVNLQLIREADWWEFPDSATKDAGLVFIPIR